LYFGSRTLLAQKDPYIQQNVARVASEQMERDENPDAIQPDALPHNLYLPTVFSVTLPFALLSYRLASVLWIAWLAGTLVAGFVLLWYLASGFSPALAGALAGLLIADSVLPLVAGNTAAIAVGLCAIAVWSFLSGRLVAVGVVCLAVSLLLKPHDTGMVWLFFLLAGRTFRRYALLTLAATIVAALPGVLVVTRVAPTWMPELHRTLVLDSARGGPNDPGPASSEGHGVGMIISLQTAVSFFWDDPAVYNTTAYAVFGVLALIWIAITIRHQGSLQSSLLGLAAIAPLSLLPLYHRQSDATILLLTIPACAMLWRKPGRARWIALALSVVAILVTGGLSWALFLAVLGWLYPFWNGITGPVFIAAQMIPAPFVLLALGIFYLYIYGRFPEQDRNPDAPVTQRYKKSVDASFPGQSARRSA
ncbi:MAG TPA: hypothetical protein VFI20_00240, partial [Terracidiphilus sp.]|nr:hypothetical protein [Terracidiphilus sp.]